MLYRRKRKIEENIIRGILLSFFLVSIYALDCPVAYHDRDHIYSDSVAFYSQHYQDLTNDQKQIYNYPFKQPFNKLPDVAIGLNQIVASKSPSLEIRVANRRITEDGVYFQAESSSESQWKNFKINFLASTRNDIQIGSASVQHPNLSTENSFKLHYQIRGDFSHSGLQVKSFLQSIDLNSQEHGTMGLKQHHSEFAGGNRLLITFSNLEKASIIRLLSISIIIYNIQTPGVLFADGIIDQNYVVSLTEITIPKHGINQLRTYLIGLNSFMTSRQGQISITSAIDETFRLVIGPIDREEIDYISVSYLILSIVDCGSCNGYPLLFAGLCKDVCPPGTVRKGSKCIGVQCQQGFRKGDNGICIQQCLSGSYYDYDSQRCLCKQGYFLIYGNCQTCPEGKQYNYKSGRCQNICPENSYFNEFYKECNCFDGYYVINGRCQKCPQGYEYNYQSGSCQDSCQIYPTKCDCKDGYRLNGVCIKCPSDQIWSIVKQECVCHDGYEFYLGSCVLYCKRNQERIGNICTCKYGYEKVNEVCTQCPQQSIYDQKQKLCFCVSGYKLYHGKCIPQCQHDEYFDYYLNKCTPYCPQRTQIFVNGQCKCYNGYERDQFDNCVPQCLHYQIRAQNNTCICIDGYYMNAYGQCRPIICPEGTQWNQYIEDCVTICHQNEVYVNGKCVCKVGYTYIYHNNHCVQECSWYEQRDKYGVCHCQDGYHRNEYGICELDCDEGSYEQNGVCICDHYHHKCDKPKYCREGQVYDHYLEKCKCPQGKIWILGHCQYQHYCGQNEYWSGKQCICNTGYYKIEGKCCKVSDHPQCPDNSQYNGINCKCLPGYFPIYPGACETCPPQTYWNGNKCSHKHHCDYDCYYDEDQKVCKKKHNKCGHNEEWDGFTCKCKQGYFLIHNKCQQCPYGTAFDGVKCSNGHPVECSDPYKVWNGEKCVCIPGYYPLSEHKCITCPADTYWNGVCCKTIYGGHEIPWTY